MPTYTVEPVYVWGDHRIGEYRLEKDGETTPIYSHSQSHAEELAAVLNLITPEQREEARKIAYRKCVLGEAA